MSVDYVFMIFAYNRREDVVVTPSSARIAMWCGIMTCFAGFFRRSSS
jgi:hypothetical protein